MKNVQLDIKISELGEIVDACRLAVLYSRFQRMTDSSYKSVVYSRLTEKLEKKLRKAKKELAA